MDVPARCGMGSTTSLLTLVAGLGGALVGALGVAVGAWLHGRNDHARWLRDQKLQAAIGVIAGTGDLLQRARDEESAGASPIDERAVWTRLQDARSAVHLLCQQDSVQSAEELIMTVGHGLTRSSKTSDPIELLQDFVAKVRSELGSHGPVGVFDFRTEVTQPARHPADDTESLATPSAPAP
jgi:hypothetical protein